MQPLTFVHISDSHLMTDPDRKGSERGPTLPGAEALIREINALPAPIEFVLHTGDVIHDPECEEEYQLALEMYRQLPMPVHYLPGNHDRSDWLQGVLLGREDPAPHADQEFEAGGVQFLLLDSSVPAVGEHYGQLEPEQLAWLEQRCAADDPRPLVVALHHNPLSLVVPWFEVIVLRDGEALHQVLLLRTKALALRLLRPHPRERADPARRDPYQSVRSSWLQLRTWFGQEHSFPEPIKWPGYNLVTLTDRDTFVRHCRVRIKTRPSSAQPDASCRIKAQHFILLPDGPGAAALVDEAVDDQLRDSRREESDRVGGGEVTRFPGNV